MMPLVEGIAERIDAEGGFALFKRQALDRSNRADFFANVIDATDRLIGILENIEDFVRLFEPSETQRSKLNVDQLHPWVWVAAAPLWSDGHYQVAVLVAANAVALQTQQKLDRRDLDGQELYAEAFSINTPKEGHARLRFPHLDRSQQERSWKSAHEGAKFFGMGCASGIRNLLAHPYEDLLTEQEALEQIAALSVLARWVDACDIEKSTGAPGSELGAPSL